MIYLSLKDRLEAAGLWMVRKANIFKSQVNKVTVTLARALAINLAFCTHRSEPQRVEGSSQRVVREVYVVKKLLWRFEL